MSAFVNGLLEDLETEVVREVSKIGQRLVELNNRGGSGAPKAPKDSGELRASVRASVGAASSERPAKASSYRNTTKHDVARAMQLGGFQPGDALFLAWVAEHAGTIEAGRRRGSDGVTRGSLQAPFGWIGPAIESVAREGARV